MFKITPSGTLTTIYSFCPGGFPCPDGFFPGSPLVQGTDGNFYGTTPLGGGSGCGDVGGCGTVFKITSSGTLTTLHSFNGADGADVTGGLMQAADGSFYGTTWGGGASHVCLEAPIGCGTVFKITPDGTFTSLHSFDGDDGYHPMAPPVQAADGNLYGTTSAGGTGNCSFFQPPGCGTLFKITSSGTLTTLYNFQEATGVGPLGLVQGTDGNFYGTTEEGGGGANGGTIFRVTPEGTETVLYSFCSQPDCADGAYPLAGLIQATDGNFYGTTSGFGANCPQSDTCGTVFRFSDGLSPTPWQFVPVTPCRVVDTRNQNGEFGGPALAGGTYRSFPIPQGGCEIPATAAAYSLNVTVVPSGSLGYLTIWPTGKSQPLVSTMNSLDGRIKANAAIVPAGASGAVDVYVSNTTDVVLDIDGYFAPVGNSTLAFYPLTPCRVLDTRLANGSLGGPYLFADQQRDFPVLDSSCIPSNANASAYSMNFTVVPVEGSLGYLTVWPTGESRPLVSTLNNPTGTIVANAAIVPAGTGGEIAVYPSNDTQLAVDINGYFAAPGQGGLSLYPTVPCRVFDSRRVGNGQPFSGTLNPPVDVVDSGCGVPSTAKTYVFNATVVPSGYLGYLTLWPDGENRPVVSTLNAIDGAITSNMAIVPNLNGKTDAYASGTTQLVLDISSYFAP